MKQLILIIILGILVISFFCKYKAKLLGNRVVHPALNQANGILENATVAAIVKYLTNFWRSLKFHWLLTKLN